jgi:hypothetical protein
MTTIGFDTLGASKRLREAGMDERLAEAVVELVQQTTMLQPSSDQGRPETVRHQRRFEATKAELKSEIASWCAPTCP